MAESVIISKTKSSFPDYLDFQKLRATGLEHIQDLGSDLWIGTRAPLAVHDHHRPGRNILNAADGNEFPLERPPGVLRCIHRIDDLCPVLVAFVTDERYFHRNGHFHGGNCTGFKRRHTSVR